jgi:hypothetical protein
MVARLRSANQRVTWRKTARLVVCRFRERNRGAQSGSHELQFYSDRSLKSGKPAVIAASKTFKFLICCESSSNRRCPRNISRSNRFRRRVSAGSRSKYWLNARIICFRVAIGGAGPKKAVRPGFYRMYKHFSVNSLRGCPQELATHFLKMLDETLQSINLRASAASI